MTMSSTITMPRFRVENIFRDASDAAFRFVNLEEKQKKQNERHAQQLESVGGKISPTWMVMSIVGLCAAIGFGIYGAFNAQGAIAGLVDPMGEGTISPKILMLIGASISIVGMVFGHLIYEGVSEGFKTDPHTGSKTLSGKIWLSVIGLIGALVYIGYQFYLVKSATNSAGIDSNSNLAYMPYVVAGIAVLELMIGALILHRTFDYGGLIIAALLLMITVRQMNRSARDTNDFYRQYIRFVDAYNSENPFQPIEREGNPNIRRAIAHYSGISLNSEQQGSVQEGSSNSSSGRRTSKGSANGNPSPGQGSGNSNRNGATHHEDAEQAARDFMEDTTDEDLTA